MSRVLVAPLGDHPVVITAAVSALQELAGVAIEQVHVLYPEHEKLISYGFDLIEDHLSPSCEAQAWPVGITDANSYNASLLYLQTLAETLECCEARGDEVFLLLAGGRKNMSALTGVIAQFFPSVKNLYHLLDRFEEDLHRRNFLSVEELFDMSKAERLAKMSPPVKHLNLVEIPFPRFENASLIRRYLRDPTNQSPPSLRFSEAAKDFYSAIFQKRAGESLLEVWLTDTAFHRFEELWRKNSNQAERFRKCFRLMQNREALKKGIHGTFGTKGATLHFFKRARTVERPFFYTEPKPIHVSPHLATRVVVCDLAVEQGSGRYKPTAEKLLESADRRGIHPISALPAREAVLLVPLGDTPMIASQTYVLLQKQGNIKNAVVVLVYPGDNDRIANGADDMKNLFEREGVNCRSKPVRNLKDVDSYNACKHYLNHVAETITDLQGEFPGRTIHMSLTGGRKGMAALNLFAAQRAHLSHIWHTLVKDPLLERQLDDDLQRASGVKERGEILFLRRYDVENFDLFAVPVFPLAEASP